MSESPFTLSAKRNYGFDAWPRRTEPPYDFWRWAHRLTTVPGYERRQSYGDADPAGERRIVMTMFTAGEASEGRLLAVQVAECESDAEAREMLALELADIMYPDLPRASERGIEVGEVAFGSP
jgi:hypothetical protein